jgi:hypothetical protein
LTGFAKPFVTSPVKMPGLFTLGYKSLRFSPTDGLPSFHDFGFLVFDLLTATALE